MGNLRRCNMTASEIVCSWIDDPNWPPAIMFETRGESMQIPPIYGRQINHKYIYTYNTYI